LIALGLKTHYVNRRPRRTTTEEPSATRGANLRLLGTIGRLQSVITAISKCSLPVIAVIQGQCLGAGVDLVTTCDMRVASTDAIFRIRETRIGLVADVGTLQRLPESRASHH
jgi:enoyl-CoA hydratase